MICLGVVEEFLRFIRCLVVVVVVWVVDMIIIVSNLGYGGVGVLVFSFDVFIRFWVRFGCILLLVVVGCDLLIMELVFSVNWKDVVDDIVDVKVSDGLLVIVVVVQSGIGNDSNGMEDIFDLLVQGFIYDVRNERDKLGWE